MRNKEKSIFLFSVSSSLSPLIVQQSLHNSNKRRCTDTKIGIDYPDDETKIDFESEPIDQLKSDIITLPNNKSITASTLFGALIKDSMLM